MTLRGGLPQRITALIGVMLVFALVPTTSWSQALTATERRLEELRQNIAEEERLLEEATLNEQKKQSRLSDLNRQLSLREALVRTYNTRIEQLVFARDSLQQAIGTLNQELNNLRAEYRERASHAYRYGRQHDAALILSASSINQMLVRVNYLRRFARERRSRLEGLRTTTDALTQQRGEMQQRLSETEIMLGAVDREQEKLTGLLGTVRREIQSIRQEKENRAESLTEKRSTEQQLMEQIQTLIASGASAPRTDRRGPSAREMTASFDGVQGSLPWPSKGPVIEPFGEIIHPEFGTRTPNPGILIGSGPSMEVMVVFGGRVSSIDIIPDMGRFAIIEHGGFHTVYGNLSLFYVSEGDEVGAGQLIGRSGTNAEPRGESVFFAIFKEGQPVDPQAWLARP